MESERIATVWQRLESILKRRPGAGLGDDLPAVARWQGGARFAIEPPHAGTAATPSVDQSVEPLLTDLPEALGGNSEGVTPGWLLRAALAACLGTRIALGAAAAGIPLESLELTATSRSDVRGLFGLRDALSGDPVSAAPQDSRLLVRLRAPGASEARLRELVEEAHRCSPVSSAMQNALPVLVQLAVETD